MREPRRLQRRVIMQEIYSIPLSSLIKEFSLEAFYLPDNAENIIISNNQVDRPAAPQDTKRVRQSNAAKSAETARSTRFIKIPLQENYINIL